MTDKRRACIGLVMVLFLLGYGLFSRQQELASSKRLEATKSRIISKDESFDALRRMATKLKTDVVPTCDIELFGIGWGGHVLCNYEPGVPCNFYSFGIADDYSFDTDVANKWGCQGFAADPTVNRSSLLHPNITFHYIAAKTRSEQNFPIVTSMPSLRKWLGHEHIAVLKMDCEGCEYSLGEDIVSEDPFFFQSVDQFPVEVHVSKTWLDTEDALHSLGLLYIFLESAGLELQHAAIGPCHPDHEKPGCMDELLQMDYPCGSGKSCHNYLFARSAKAIAAARRESSLNAVQGRP